MPWTPVGPDGGDARALTAVPGEPNHLYLGTTNSLIYESMDEGATWHRLAKLDPEDDLVIDHILVDATNSSRIYVATWKFDRSGGALFISQDKGKTWADIAGLHGQSIRAFTQSPSNPKTLFAGTLQGVFRSNDAGATWSQISPPGSKELHEVESLAVDPTNPDILYVGTWHLPWKTSDGGKNWENIKQGVIDDSDVFSIIVDPVDSNTVYASACSGIYKSENAGSLFKKIQGIPATARRTRVLRQDPVHRDTVYAGTTEGLYKTTDAGKTFQRMTGPDVIVNDVFVDPKNPERVLLATDRGGVISSTDAAVSFVPSNQGFSARKVEALLVDAHDPQRIYAGVVNDKTYGGVFVSPDSGAQWKQIETGLEGRDVFTLAQAQDGIILAGTNKGIFKLEPNADAWKASNTIANVTVGHKTVLRHGKKVPVEIKVKEKERELASRVYGLDISGDTWAAATGSGLFTSKNKGESWQGGLVAGASDYFAVAAHGDDMAGAGANTVVVSSDSGEKWSPVVLPSQITRIHRLAFSADGTLWLAAREGVFYSRDKGATWAALNRLPMVDVTDMFYDTAHNAIVVSSRATDFIYSIDPEKLDWKWRQTGYRMFRVRTAGDKFIAASLVDGVLIEPRSTTFQVTQK